MSDDSYGIVHYHGDGYGLTMGSGSEERRPSLARPYFTAPTLAEVVAYADQEYFEYGWSFDPPVRDEVMSLRDLERRDAAHLQATAEWMDDHPDASFKGAEVASMLRDGDA